MAPHLRQRRQTSSLLYLSLDHAELSRPSAGRTRKTLINTEKMTRICSNERIRQIMGSIDSESDYLSTQNVSKHNRLGRITIFLTWVTRHSEKARPHRDVDGWIPFEQIKKRSQARQLEITDMDIF